jgi:hypothetical protein
VIPPDLEPRLAAAEELLTELQHADVGQARRWGTEAMAGLFTPESLRDGNNAAVRLAAMMFAAEAWAAYLKDPSVGEEVQWNG